MFLARVAAYLVGLMVILPALAAEPASEEITEHLKKQLALPGSALVVDTVFTSEIKGLYEVRFENGPVVYATASGDYFVAGDLYAVGASGFVNLAERRRDGERAELLADVKTEDMIVFAAEGETRAAITVFTDVTCFYCQKLHLEVPELNRLGIEVRYLAYPRSGVGSEGYRKLATAWCAENRQDALTRLKAGESLPENVCAGNPVAEEYRLGQAMGVQGTPAIITQEGRLMPGYRQADELVSALGLE